MEKNASRKNYYTQLLVAPPEFSVRMGSAHPEIL
jgi:hypothetical protein